MRILLSNDDGVLAPGLAALYEAVADMGEITVFAPATPQSATGHSITLKTPLPVQRIRINGNGEKSFAANSVDGRPADCVRLAVRKLLPNRPDIVLAGINDGANAGVNVFYSGTVAAAAEAAMIGIPAVAFSAGYDNGKPIDYGRAGRLCRWVFDRLLAIGLRKRDLITVNLPAGVPRGVRIVPQSTAELEDMYHETVDHRGMESYRLSDYYTFAHHLEGTDVGCLAKGYITITPLHVDMTMHERLGDINDGRWDALPD